MSEFDFGDMEYVDHCPRPTPGTLKQPGMKVAVFSKGRERKLLGTGEYTGEELYFCPQHGAGTHACIHMDPEYQEIGEVVYGCDFEYVPVDKLPQEVQNHLKAQQKFGRRR